MGTTNSNFRYQVTMTFADHSSEPTPFWQLFEEGTKPICPYCEANISFCEVRWCHPDGDDYDEYEDDEDDEYEDFNASEYIYCICSTCGREIDLDSVVEQQNKD